MSGNQHALAILEVDDVKRGLSDNDGFACAKAVHHPLRKVEALFNERADICAELLCFTALLKHKAHAVAKKGTININAQFPLFFEAQMSKNLMEILKSSGYPNLQTADFSLAGFDAYINNRQKSTQGKGYRSYINSCVTLALYKILFESAVHNPGFVIIDTPLNGLDDPQEISDDATSELHNFRDILQHAFYQTLIRLAEYGQIIVMDNNKNLPELPSLEGKCDLIEFTKSTKRGRYGLLEGKTQDDFQDQEYVENEIQDEETTDQEGSETEKVEVDD